jgi:hypothetical protein
MPEGATTTTQILMKITKLNKNDNYGGVCVLTTFTIRHAFEAHLHNEFC